MKLKKKVEFYKKKKEEEKETEIMLEEAKRYREREDQIYNKARLKLYQEKVSFLQAFITFKLTMLHYRIKNYKNDDALYLNPSKKRRNNDKRNSRCLPKFRYNSFHFH